VIEGTFRLVLDRVPLKVRLELMRRLLYNRSWPVVALRALLQQRAVRRWEMAGRNDSPPAPVKYHLIREYRRRFDTRVLIETGTFLGDNIYALRHDFDRIISIELAPDLAARARQRFARESHVSILLGDSASVLPEVLAGLNEPTLFWLDAHWSGGITAHAEKETPIAAEIDAILRHPVKDHVVLIDDARLLGQRQDYPTLETLCTNVRHLNPSWTCELSDGIVRLHTQRQ
jgi:hypothetical protein